MKRSTLSIAVAAVALAAFPAASRAQRYTFNVPAKLVNISFESRMAVEDIVGSSNKIRGYVKRSSSGKVTFALKVPVKSLKTGISMRDQHLRSHMWLNAARYPYIQFVGSKARKLSAGRWRVTGLLTVRGVSRRTTVVVRVRKIGAALAARAGLGKANWLRVRAQLTIRLSQHGIRIPGMAAAKVNDKWTVKISLFARQTP